MFMTELPCLLQFDTALYCLFVSLQEIRTSSDIFVATKKTGELDISSHICVQTNVGVFDFFEEVGTLPVVFFEATRNPIFD